jgi:ribosomal protein L18
MKNRKDRRKSRKKRSKLIEGTLQKPRVVIYKSNLYLSAQAIDDEKNNTLVADTTANFFDVKTFCKKNQDLA